MITINSSGRLGNKLIYFILGMKLHEVTGFKFIPERINGFINTYDIKDGSVIGPQVRTSEIWHTYVNFFDEVVNLKRGIIVDHMINKYSDFKMIDVKNYLQMEDYNFTKPKKDELVIHIRLGDYKTLGCSIEKEYYMTAIELEKNNINKVTILTDSPNDNYLEQFKLLGCDIKSSNELEDFAYIKNANKICISNSTFSWLSAFISNAETVYWPISADKWPYKPNPGKDDTDLRPLDKKNWIYI